MRGSSAISDAGPVVAAPLTGNAFERFEPISHLALYMVSRILFQIGTHRYDRDAICGISVQFFIAEKVN
jgi:hypothetical protein